ncbi:cation-transporting P-type ATPase [Listeria aquatica]|uniref:cation-transporting P-type ATPase n=1 Tax=Listeria aquatica TaxID=1494960 RepID=UPI0030C67D93
MKPKKNGLKEGQVSKKLEFYGENRTKKKQTEACLPVTTQSFSRSIYLYFNATCCDFTFNSRL